jgi:death-on-curing protein
MSEPVWLMKTAMMAAHDMLIARFGGPAGVRSEELLESALARPQNLFHYEGQTSLAHLAAAYAAGITGNHPFVDGNKRSGFLAAFMFLDLNGATLTADEISATTMTMGLAAGEIDEATYGNWLADNIELRSE